MIQSQTAEVYTVEGALAAHFSSMLATVARAIQCTVHSILSLGGRWRPFLTDQTEQRRLHSTGAPSTKCTGKPVSVKK